ncbi:MAG TPA: FlgD immunoglobulin-like domain containing protein [Miltoncostaeaceae bacterium]|nr:FlgD immunoglobulin-like domain containing protein [Miltoncostaeaceae bacterium]
MSGDGSPRDGRARRAGVVVAIVALFVLGLGNFVLPFAFPTPPPVVTRFNATRLFSPDGDGRREDAKVNVRLSEAAAVTVEVQKDGTTVRRLITDRTAPRGWVREDWDGRDDDGQVVPDGTYALKLRAHAGKKQFNTTRAIVVDTEAPRPAEMTVESATLGKPGPGECRVSFSSRDEGSVLFEAFREGPVAAGTAASSDAVRRLGPRPVRPGDAVTWRWDGRRADGGQVPPGLYLIRASLFDAARNRVVRDRTCWVGYLAGTAVPSSVAPRQLVGADLRRTDGDPLPSGNTVTLALYRRTGTPGETLGDPLGAQVGGGARGPAGTVRVKVPPRINPSALWLVARTDDGLSAALVPLRGSP